MQKIIVKKCERCKKIKPHIHFEGRVYFIGEEEEKEFLVDNVYEEFIKK